MSGSPKFAKTLSSAVMGIDAYTVKVEAHLENASPAIFTTMGASGRRCRGKQGVMASIKNFGYKIQCRLILCISVKPYNIDFWKEISG